MGKEKEVHGLSKVPDSVIILTQLDEIKQLKQKNHEIVQKAKEREEHWKAYTDELLNTIQQIQKSEKSEEDRAVAREAKALKKKDQDYQQLLSMYNKLKLEVKRIRKNTRNTIVELYKEGKI